MIRARPSIHCDAEFQRVWVGVGRARGLSMPILCSRPLRGRKRWSLTLLQTAVVQLSQLTKETRVPVSAKRGRVPVHAIRATARMATC
jgi:hypothetical protein